MVEVVVVVVEVVVLLVGALLLGAITVGEVVTSSEASLLLFKIFDLSRDCSGAGAAC